jgi:hypothetical protein
VTPPARRNAIAEDQRFRAKFTDSSPIWGGNANDEAVQLATSAATERRRRYRGQIKGCRGAQENLRLNLRKKHPFRPGCGCGAFVAVRLHLVQDIEASTRSAICLMTAPTRALLSHAIMLSNTI